MATKATPQCDNILMRARQARRPTVRNVFSRPDAYREDRFGSFAPPPFDLISPCRSIDSNSRLLTAKFWAIFYSMVARKDFDGLERLLRPLRRELSFELANALVRLQADEEIQSRYDELAERNSAGVLTSNEKEELESLVRANSLLGVLKIEARAVLASKQSPG